MAERIRNFWSPEVEEKFVAAYEAVLRQMDESMGKLRRLAQVSGYLRYRPTQNPPPSVFSDEELRSIKSPVLLLIGDHEVIYKPAAVFRRARRLVPGLQAEMVPNANHCAQYTAPERVNQRVLEFLAN